MADITTIEKGYFMLLGVGKSSYEGKDSYYASICAPDPSDYPKIQIGYLANKCKIDEDQYYDLKKHKPLEIIKGVVYSDSKKGLIIVSLG